MEQDRPLQPGGSGVEPQVARSRGQGGTSLGTTQMLSWARTWQEPSPIAAAPGSRSEEIPPAAGASACGGETWERRPETPQHEGASRHGDLAQERGAESRTQVVEDDPAPLAP